MGAGTSKLREAGTGRIIKWVGYGKSVWRHNLYRHGGKCYKITGNAWTGWYRHNITRSEYERLADWYRQQKADQWQELRSKPYFYNLKPIEQTNVTTLQDWLNCLSLPQ